MKNKRLFYISASILLGLLLAILSHALIEIYFINSSLNQNLVPPISSLWGKNCYLPFYIDLFLIIFGSVGGYFWGKFWWQRLYTKKN